MFNCGLIMTEEQTLIIQTLDRVYAKAGDATGRMFVVATAWVLYTELIEQCIAEDRNRCWPRPLIRAAARARSVMQ